ncbi:hypothetical protein D3C72_1577340 [compost metagenome]
MQQQIDCELVRFGHLVEITTKLDGIVIGNIICASRPWPVSSMVLHGGDFHLFEGSIPIIQCLGQPRAIDEFCRVKPERDANIAVMNV